MSIGPYGEEVYPNTVPYSSSLPSFTQDRTLLPPFNAILQQPESNLFSRMVPTERPSLISPPMQEQNQPRRIISISLIPDEVEREQMNRLFITNYSSLPSSSSSSSPSSTEQVPTNQIRPSRKRTERTSPVDRSGIFITKKHKTSMKKAGRIYGLSLMYSSHLPFTRPHFIHELEWINLQQLKSQNQLVQLVSLAYGTLTVELPESVDMLYHSLVNYCGREARTSRKTRFRWWTDSEIAQIKPIKNLASRVGMIQRQISLPDVISEHPYLLLLKEDKQNHKILEKISSLFISVSNRYVDPSDHMELQKKQGFGRTRVILTQTAALDLIFNEEVDKLVVELNKNHEDALQESFLASDDPS